MPYPLDSEAEDAIAAGRLKAAYLVDLYVSDGVDPLTLRWWDWPDTVDYPANDAIDDADPVTYVSMARRMICNMALRQAATLSSEPLTLLIDGSRSGDDADEVGKLVDADWHQRPVRVRQILLNFDTGAAGADPIREWRGLLDHREQTSRPGEQNIWQVTCQGGLFRTRGRRLRTRSHTDQQRRSAGDNFYIGTANMVGRPLNWAKKPGNIPGTAGGTAGGAPGLWPGFGIFPGIVSNLDN